ncbi:restriction endonuclease subunit S [Sphingobacterium anhuiense]|uniref:Restriction endonuclease subunit S n=1 Tax=Sphingobacterium anhuiense TaxID=493780 RepID=A0ABW5YQ78_9SPHI
MRFPEFEGEWATKRLGEICEIKTGNKDTQNKIDNGKYPFFVRSNTVEKINSYSFDGEAILTSGDGVGVGKNFHYIDGKFDFHQRVYALRNFEKGYYGKFIYNVFSEKFYNRVIKLSAKNSVDSVRMNMISEMKILFPKISEQIKIAQFLSLINERIQTQNKIIENLKTQMLGLQEKIFKQKIKFKDSEENEFQLWGCKNGGELFESISNKKHDSDLPILAITQDQGAVPRNMIDYQITVTERSVDSYKVVEIGDFIISLRSFQGGIEHSAYKGICSPAYIILRNKVEIATNFYKYYFKTPSYIKLLNKKLEGIRDGKMISYSYFSEIPIPFPPLNEQKRIASFLLSIDQKIQIEKSILEQIEKQKKHLLQQMFI